MRDVTGQSHSLVDLRDVAARILGLSRLLKSIFT